MNLVRSDKELLTLVNWTDAICEAEFRNDYASEGMSIVLLLTMLLTRYKQMSVRIETLVEVTTRRPENVKRAFARGKHPQISDLGSVYL